MYSVAGVCFFVVAVCGGYTQIQEFVKYYKSEVDDFLTGDFWGDSDTRTEHVVSEENVVLFLSTRENRGPHHKVDRSKFRIVDGEKEKSIFIVHGWIDSAQNTWPKTLTHQLLTRGDYNVFRVDWSRYSMTRYVSAVRNSRKVGKILGNFISEMHQKQILHLKDIHLICHSLGAHLCGITGKTVQNKTFQTIGRITGLDPAAPLFETSNLAPVSSRLDRKDAQMVDVIHTDAGKFGFKSPLGTLDYFPNGGTRQQPGCTVLPPGIPSNSTEALLYVFCNHVKSIGLFNYSINGNLFATQCDSWDGYSTKKCDSNLKIPFGFDAPRHVRGLFFFKTNSKVPYVNE